MNKKSILCIVGARPNFMKIAPIMKALRAEPNPIPAKIVHTGQHYDEAMNKSFFADLGIPHPDINLEVGSGSHAVQTAEVMRRFEPVLDQEQPAAILVVGDVNSTIACALVAAKKGIAVIHVEAGLRSYDRGMPEEINRVLTDQISDLLYITERSALANLTREGVDPSRVHFVGNVMIDTLHHNLQQAIPGAQTLRDSGMDLSQGYALLTLHRPSNVDHAESLRDLLETINQVSERLPVVFPLHPRTKSHITQFGLDGLLAQGRYIMLPPVGYLQMLGLMREAKIVLTDSGGIQEETTALGVPCLTLRHNTERPITVEEGTNLIVGQSRLDILAATQDILLTGGKAGRIPELWDGHAAERITAHLHSWLKERPKTEAS